MIAMLAAVAIAASPSCGLPPLAPGERAWRAGETLTFDLDVFGVVKAGRIQLSVERAMSGGSVVPLRARAKTVASVANLKKFTAVGLSWVDARTLIPERYRDESEEDGVHKMSDVRMRPPASEIVVEYRYGNEVGKSSYPRDGEVLDAISTLYYLRAAQLSAASRLCFGLVANRRFWHLEGSVASKTERVDTPAGRFDTFRVDAKLTRVDQPQARPRSVHLWLTTDARHLLVAMVSEVDLGPVRALLSGVRGAR